MDHLMLNYKFAIQVWKASMSNLGIPINLMINDDVWGRPRARMRPRGLRLILTTSICWYLWRERNDRSLITSPVVIWSVYEGL